MGLKYTLYRGYYELKKRTGLLRLEFPVIDKPADHITLEDWRNNTPPFFFKDRDDLPGSLKDYTVEHEEVSRIINGELKFFSGEWIRLGKNYDWVTHPITGTRFRNDVHWSQIDEFSKDAGDIKYLWEKSRFTFIYPIIRYDFQQGDDHSAFIFSEIESWIRNNPVNRGPNYVCSQEISIRVFNWVFALYFYKKSGNLTPALFREIMDSIFWQVDHVYRNIHFSRITVRNNHAITETLLLFLSGLLFPFFRGSKKWRKRGQRWFEQEIDYQVYDDGTYLQFSMNYHRVVIQLLSWAIAISRIHKVSLKASVLDKALKSVDFLLQCQEITTGHLPNYGANDGALFFPLSSCEYRDFRPQLDTLHHILTGRHLYPDGPWTEESHWIRDENKNCGNNKKLSQHQGVLRFDTGGYYLFREEHTLTFIRCGKHKDRPSQADNLHIDIWHQGENMLVDAGAYLYNCSDIDWEYFAGTKGHNCVTLKDQDQMLHGGRFIWYGWSQACAVEISETDHAFIFKGSITAFRHLGKDITHTRVMEKKKGMSEWVVRDIITSGSTITQAAQHWHTLSPDRVTISNDSGPFEWTNSGWFSPTYGVRQRALQLTVNSENRIFETRITLR